MPKTLVPISISSQAGTVITATPADATNDHSLDNNGNAKVLMAYNFDESNPKVLEFVTPFTKKGLALAEATVTVPAKSGASALPGTMAIGRLTNDVFGGVADVDNSISNYAVEFSITSGGDNDLYFAWVQIG